MLTRSLREATRSVHVSYPVPYLVTLLFSVSLAMIGLARGFSGLAVLLLLATAILCLLTGLAILCWAVFVRPNLLKSEKFDLFERMMSVMGDDEMGAEDRVRLQALMISHSEAQWSRKPMRHVEGNSEEEGGRE